MRTLRKSKIGIFLFLVLIKGVFGVFLDDSANGGCFLFCYRLMLLRVMSVKFELTCAVSWK